MKKKRIVAVALLAMLLATFAVGGCTPTKHTRDQEEAVQKEATEKLESYLQENYDRYTINSVHMVSGAKLGDSIYSGYYTSRVAQTTSWVPDQRLELAIDLETDNWYTGDTSVLKDYFSAVWEDILAEAGFQGSWALGSPLLELTVENHGVKSGKDVLDVEVLLTDMIPLNWTNANIADVVKNDLSPVYFQELTVYCCCEVGSITEAMVQEFLDECAGIHSGAIRVINLEPDDYEDVVNGKAYYNENSMDAAEIFSMTVK